MSVLWTAVEAARATGGEACGDWRATGVSIDTRSLQPGDLFVALQAARDGHDFVARALEAGAAAALVSHVPEGVARDRLLIVDDVQRGLEALGAAGRARMTGRMIAVTGSVGKTTTKEMLRAALTGQGAVHAAEASFNNHWGVPVTLARMPPDTDFAVVEIGMNAPGEIAPLSRLARPHVTLITTVAAAHLEAFDDLAGIAREKAAIAEGLEPGGAQVLPGEVPEAALRVLETSGGSPVQWFGAGQAHEYRLERVAEAPETMVVEAATPLGPAIYKLAASGRHLALNALGALAASVAAGADLALSAQGLGRWSPPTGRGRRERVVLDPVEDRALVLFDDAFNANPASVAAGLDVLIAAEPEQGGRRIAVLGDMLELGPQERAFHEDIAMHPGLEAIDVIHCAGPRMRALHDVLPAGRQGEWAETAAELAARIHRLVRPGDVVLVKGSKGALTASIVDAIRKLGHRRQACGKGTD